MGPYFASTTTEFNSHARRISLDDFKVHPLLPVFTSCQCMRTCHIHGIWTSLNYHLQTWDLLGQPHNLHRKKPMKRWCSKALSPHDSIISNVADLASSMGTETLDLSPCLKTGFLAFFKLNNSSGLGLIGKDEAKTPFDQGLHIRAAAKIKWVIDFEEQFDDGKPSSCGFGMVWLFVRESQHFLRRKKGKEQANKIKLQTECIWVSSNDIIIAWQIVWRTSTTTGTTTSAIYGWEILRDRVGPGRQESLKTS